MLGDSITVESGHALHRVLDDRYRNKISAIIGEGFGGGPRSKAVGASPSVLTQAAQRDAKDNPAIVVLALGTNDAWSSALALDPALAAIRKMDALFPNVCVVAVAVNEWSTANGL